MRETIGGIFEKHGVSIPGGLQEGGGRYALRVGSTGSGAAVGPAFDVMHSLMEHLQAENSDSSQQHKSADQYADALVSRLLGVEFRA